MHKIIFYDIEFLLLEPWWESKKPPKPIVAQRTLYDIRDNNSYTIRKLADGNCWMTSNLKYKLSADVSATGSYNNGDTFSFTPTSCDSAGGCLLDGNTVMVEQVTNGGYYYNWYAATAGIGTKQTVTDTDGSICPAHWKIPFNYTYNNDRSLGKLMAAYIGSPQIQSGNHTELLESSPLDFLRAGYIDNGVPAAIGSTGFYWASTASSSSSIVAHRLNYSVNETNPQGEAGKFRGFTVRCVAQ